MKTAYFDCFAGASGDMIIGAFLDSGLDFTILESELAKLNISGYTLSYEKCTKNNISASKFNVKVISDQTHRSLSSIIKIIESSDLHPVVKSNAISIFSIIGKAEAHVHDADIESIHFHEIGGIDSIIDICGAAICFHTAGIDKIISSPINTGSGFVETAHGTLPVPAPATAEILKGVPVYSSGIKSELTTPTGAAVIKHYCSEFSSLPNLTTKSIGYGSGTKNLIIPNVLRLIIGDGEVSKNTDDEVAELETAIDDMNPEFYSYLFEILLKEGALDVSVIPAVMKKNRPGHILKILSPKEKADRIADIVFRETTTSGIRINIVKRKIMERTLQVIETKYGPIKVKIHNLNGISATLSPEYEDCRNAAIKHNVPLKEVYNEAVVSAQKFF
ncbi:MAG: TIGR00299 family protein [Spirochaetae bacterium HGW-Spirochaetae-5]|nr:MAG: TIGR00299 family protein [Spirochaetae bacterium HGW-Spirochaetae-5]